MKAESLSSSAEVPCLNKSSPTTWQQLHLLTERFSSSLHDVLVHNSWYPSNQQVSSWRQGQSLDVEIAKAVSADKKAFDTSWRQEPTACGVAISTVSHKQKGLVLKEETLTERFRCDATSFDIQMYDPIVNSLCRLATFPTSQISRLRAFVATYSPTLDHVSLEITNQLSLHSVRYSI